MKKIKFNIEESEFTSEYVKQKHCISVLRLEVITLAFKALFWLTSLGFSVSFMVVVSRNPAIFESVSNHWFKYFVNIFGTILCAVSIFSATKNIEGHTEASSKLEEAREKLNKDMSSFLDKKLKVT